MFHLCSCFDPKRGESQGRVQAVQALRGLPPETQDALARILMQLAGDDPSTVRLSADEEASFEASLAQAERREFATDDQIKAIWAKHSL